MPYLCLNCGEQQDFEADGSGTATVTCTNYLDQHHNLVEREDEEYDNVEIDEEDDLRCSNCGEAPAQVSDDVWKNFNQDHYEETGEYYKKKKIKTWKQRMAENVK